MPLSARISTIRRRLTFLTLLLALLLPASVLAQDSDDRSVTWQRFDVHIEVRPDGAFEVTETQQIEFRGRFSEGFRDIPLERVTRISDVRVGEVRQSVEVPYTRGSGNPDTFATSTEDDTLGITWWMPPTSGVQVRTFIVHYVVHGGLRIYEGGDQLWWRAVFADRPSPVQASDITVRLPEPVSAEMLSTAFYRYRPSDRQGDASRAGEGRLLDDRTVLFQVGSLPANVGAEVRVEFPSGLVPPEPPAWQEAADREAWLRETFGAIGSFLSLVLALGIVAGGGVLLLLRWRARGQDPSVGAVPPLLDGPPSDLPAPVVGTLIDENAQPRDVVAALVDLGQRGLVTLEPTAAPKSTKTDDDVLVHLHVSLDEHDLRPYERTLLKVLFGRTDKDKPLRLSSAQTRFMKQVPKLQEQLYEAAVNMGLFPESPQKTRGRYYALGTFLLVGGGVLGFLAPAILDFVELAWMVGAALALMGAAVLATAGAMPRRTPHGALEAAKWRAFRDHLTRASKADQRAESAAASDGESDRASTDAAADDTGTARSSGPRTDSAADPWLRPEYLPYAVAFGIDESWLERLQESGTAPPTWYHVPGYYPGAYYGGVGYARGESATSGSTTAGAGAALGGGIPSPQAWSNGLTNLLNSTSSALSGGGTGGSWGGSSSSGGSGGFSGGGSSGGGGGGGGGGGFR